MAMIRDLLQDDVIIAELEATGKEEVLHEFSRLLKAKGRIEDEEELVRVLRERESLGSTGIGDGVAIPHAKLRSLPEMIVAFGRSSRGVNFLSLDAKPVHLFFLLLSPDDKPGEHLKALARISRLLKNPVLREDLKRVSGSEELRRLICEEDKKYPQPQAARHT
jgi:PTS system nitrogen regulatory IIA component